MTKKIMQFVLAAAIAFSMLPGNVSAMQRFENDDVQVVSKLPAQYVGYNLTGSTGTTALYYKVTAVVTGVGETKASNLSITNANAVRSSTNTVQVMWSGVQAAPLPIRSS